MATWYVRPDTSHSATRNGTSYATAWAGHASITWGGAGVVGGDTVYYCGTHASSAISFNVGAHGASSAAAPVTLRCDYEPDPGSLTFSSTAGYANARNYTVLDSMTVTCTGTGVCVFSSATAGFKVLNSELIGGVLGILLSGGVAHGDTTFRGNTIHGQTGSTGRGIALLSTLGSTALGPFTLDDNEIYNTTESAIHLSIESAAWDTTYFNGVTVTNNNIHDCAGASIRIRASNTNMAVRDPVIPSRRAMVTGNVVNNCGTTHGASGKHGGLHLVGFSGGYIAHNRFTNVYVEGGAIQCQKNAGIVAAFNYIKTVRTGTPTAQYNNGGPIDGNGVFWDNASTACVSFGNYVEDLVTVGTIQGGVAYAFWDCTNCAHFGNVAYNCFQGVQYGDVDETGNIAAFNTFIAGTNGATALGVGVIKIGDDTLAGSFTVKNNIFSGYTTGFEIDIVDPSITEDYNCVYGATTAYSGISQGANSITADPLLTRNHEIGSDSPCYRTAVYIPNARDYAGRKMRNPPDMGAHQYNAAREAVLVPRT